MGRLVEKRAGDVRILGYSVAGEEAVVIAPEHNVAFDVGRAPREVIPIDNVCLSHGHMDHAAGVAYYFSQRGFVDLPPGRIVVHRGLAQSIQKLMDVWSDIEGHPSPGVVYGVEHLDEVEIRRGLFLRAFTVNHAGYALGYSLIERRHKLRPEFAGKSGAQLVELKKQGVVIDENMEVVLLTYTGDTALGRFLELDFVRKSRALLLECTFFDDDHASRARAGRHIHVEDVPQVCAAVPEAQIILTHLTRRTDMRSAKRILEKTLRAEDGERVSFLMDRPRTAAPAASMPVPIAPACPSSMAPESRRPT
jgi:ribonuclease Z